MKEIVVLSGKGGTGKTSIVGSFAAIAGSKVMADCDVDAADLHLILNTKVREENEFWSGQVAEIDEIICTQCGLCAEICEAGAIDNYRINEVLCEGCGFCYRVCPVGAINMKDSLAGYWYISDTKYGKLVHARLNPAKENSGKLVATVRRQARELAEKQGSEYIITDGPPGIGCPVISSLSGASMALVVTEPTLTGIHDLERIIGVCGHFNVPALVCINKYDINHENTGIIEDYSAKQGLKIAGRIPYDDVVTEAMVHNEPVVTYARNGVARLLEELWETVENSVTG